ncbi:unnamed protein product [Sphagnum balticum]
MADAWQEYLQSQERVDGVRFTWNVWPHSRIEVGQTRTRSHTGTFLLPGHPLHRAAGGRVHATLRTTAGSGATAAAALRSSVVHEDVVQGRAESILVGTAVECAQSNNDATDLSVRCRLVSAPRGTEGVEGIAADGAQSIAGESPTAQANSQAAQVNALVGLITYGRMVHVHELGVAGMPRAYVFKGAKEVTKEQLQKIVTRPATGAQRAGGQQTPSTPGLGQPPPPGQMLPPGQQQQRKES